MKQETFTDIEINRRPSGLLRVSDKAIDWERHIENRKSSGSRHHLFVLEKAVPALIWILF